MRMSTLLFLVLAACENRVTVPGEVSSAASIELLESQTKDGLERARWRIRENTSLLLLSMGGGTE